MGTATKKQEEKVIVSVMPNHKTVIVHIKGIAPLLCNRMSGAQRDRIIREAFDREPGKKTKKSAEDKPDLEYLYHESRYMFGKNKLGINALAMRSALISASRNTGFTMAQMKQTLFVIADGVDLRCGTPVIGVIGKPVCISRVTRTDKGKMVPSICTMWEDWTMKVKIEYDADILSDKSIAELVQRAGLQVGLGTGRPESKTGKGGVNGRFKISSK